MHMRKMLAIVAGAVLVAGCSASLAANPFSDVPLNSWAYDAVMQLNSRGILSGFPNGTFRGNQPMTRYELASTVARLLATVEMDKASKEDVEILKRLVVEFKDELDALGIKTAAVDTRVGALEKGVGGWELYGQVRFDLGKSESDGFGMDSVEFYLTKQLSENDVFVMRLGGSTFEIERFYVSMEDFAGLGLDMIVGKNWYDFQDEDGLTYCGPYGDSWGPYYNIDGFYFVKSFGMLDFSGFAGEDADGTNNDIYGAQIKFNFNEKLWASANIVNDYGYEEGNYAEGEAGGNTTTYWAAVGYEIMPSVQLKGAYYWQTINFEGRDDGNAYSVIAEIGQDFLKFTSLWVEYTHFDGDFMTRDGNAFNPWAIVSGNHINRALAANFLAGEDTKVWNVIAEQEWNDQWGTFARYTKVDSDGIGDGYAWTVGVNYHYNSNITFELAYEKNVFDYMGMPDEDEFESVDEGVVRFSTFITF